MEERELPAWPQEDQPSVPEIITKPVTNDRELAFKVDGEGYYLPRVVTPAIALRASKMLRHHGDVHASTYALEQLLGAEQYDRLASNDSLTTEQLETIAKLVVSRALGPLEGRT